MATKEDYEALMKAFYKFKNLFDSYTIRLNNNDKEALQKGLYGMLDMTITMDRVSELYQIIKEDPAMHYEYLKIAKEQRIEVLNKIHTDEEIKLMPYIIEKQVFELSVEKKKLNDNKKFKV